MTTEWYIGFDGQVVGPVDQQQLLDFLTSSEQWRQILVWHAGMDEWKLAKDVPDIASQIPKGPPPLPAPVPPPMPTAAPKSEAPQSEAAKSDAPKSEAPSIVPAAPAETVPTDAAKPVEPAPAAAPAPVEAPAVVAAPTPAPVVEIGAAPAPLVVAATHQTVERPRRRWGWGATALTILLLLGGAFAAQKFQLLTRSMESLTVAKAIQPSNDATLERGFAEIVQATALPKKLDDYTTRLDVTPAGKRLVFHHLLDTSRYLVPQNFAAVTKEKMLPEACTPAAREALKAGGTLEYRFHTQAAFLIGSFEISGNDCGQPAPKS